MSAYPPPNENLSIFDSNNFYRNTEDPQTIARLSQYFLKYPQSQGSETINGTFAINGVYLNNAIQITGTTDFSIATAPYYAWYNIATTQSTTITATLPTPVSALNGVVIRFRKTNNTAVAINTTPTYYDYTGSLNNVLLTASATTQQGQQISFVCLLTTGTTYAWFRVP
jgi:hypothetical protein